MRSSHVSLLRSEVVQMRRTKIIRHLFRNGKRGIQKRKDCGHNPCLCLKYITEIDFLKKRFLILGKQTNKKLDPNLVQSVGSNF